MLFENVNQYERAKSALIKESGDVEKSFELIKNDNIFMEMSENELKSALYDLNEGLGEMILNFGSKLLGGDISKIDDVLKKMKEQELKFNREEFDIYNQFYSLVQDKKAIEKDKGNPNQREMLEDTEQSMNLLNKQWKELTKSHNEIFNSMEEKIKSLTGDNNRKKKYFNAKRADDVLATRTDRYEKIKSLAAKNKERSEELEDFFGVSTDKLKKDVDKAEANYKKQEDVLAKQKTPDQNKYSFSKSPEFAQRLKEIKDNMRVNTKIKTKKALAALENDIKDIMSSDNFKSYSMGEKRSIANVFYEVQNLIEKLTKS